MICAHTGSKNQANNSGNHMMIPKRMPRPAITADTINGANEMKSTILALTNLPSFSSE